MHSRLFASVCLFPCVEVCVPAGMGAAAREVDEKKVNIDEDGRGFYYCIIRLCSVVAPPTVLVSPSARLPHREVSVIEVSPRHS